MRPIHFFRVGACALVMAACVVALSGPAAAQSSCSEGAGLASVDVDRPFPNSVAIGQVRVEGSAQAAVGFNLSRVEISVGGEPVTRTYEPSPSIEFSVLVDVRDLEPGPATVRVVACGTGLTGALAQGEREFSITIQAPPSTTAPRASSTVPSQSGAAAGSDTTAAPTTTRPGQADPIGATSTTAAPPTTEPRVEVYQPEPVRPKSAGDAPVILTQTPADKSPRPPLWVGAVVGVSGALGLGFSAASWRRRTHGPQPAEPVDPADPDLVEVG